LAQALDASGPQAVAALKAEIATAAEATRQLNLSREIQTDAQEMVRRAEFSLGKAIRQGQAEGTVNSSGDHALPDRKSTRDFFSGGTTTVETYAMADAGEEAFEAALAQAKAEGNVSRANVVRKLECIDLVTGEVLTEDGAAAYTRPAPVPAAPRRRPLTDAFWEAAYDLGKKAESLLRLVEDDRWASNRDAVADKNLAQMRETANTLARVLAALTENPQGE